MGTVNRQQERREMIISETWKNLLRRVTSCKRVEKDMRPAASGIHSTPAGRYPEGGPKPSKLGVLFYVISILFSLIGVITLTRYPFVSQADRLNLLIVGLPILGAGMLSLVVTNYIVNREQQAFVAYLNLKVEQYIAQHKRNLQAIPPDDDGEV